MSKRSSLEAFIERANLYEYDYGSGTKPLPLLSQLPSDPPGVYTTNIPLLTVPLVGDLGHAGDKFRFKDIVTVAPVQEDDWKDVPLSKRTEVLKDIYMAGLGQGGGSAKLDAYPFRTSTHDSLGD